MTPPTRRTWSPVGRTPELRIAGRHRNGISLAGICCYHPDRAPVLLYATREHSFTNTTFPALLTRLHRRLNAPIVLIWDNLSAHLSGKTLQYTKDNTAWLTVVQLPAYAPDLNPTEGVWAHLKNTSLANLAARSLPELTHAARRGLRHIQRHPALLAGFLTHTGLTLDPTPSTP